MNASNSVVLVVEQNKIVRQNVGTHDMQHCDRTIAILNFHNFLFYKAVSLSADYKYMQFQISSVYNQSFHVFQRVSIILVLFGKKEPL